MAKRFKLKLSRVIPSFHSCRSKDDSLPSNPPTVPSFSPTFLNLRLPPPPIPKPHHCSSSFKRHVSSAFGCGNRSSSDHTLSPPTPEFHWEKQDKWHVVAKIYTETTSPRRKIYNSSASENDDVLLPPPPAEKKKRLTVKKKKTTLRNRNSTSSADSGLFSSEGYENEDDDFIDDQETETLVSSSRSFSTDSSSEIKSPFERARARKKQKKKARKNHYSKRCGSKARKSYEGLLSPARLSKFQWLIPCTVDGKVRESFAVVKKSEDPYEDFKKSMMEMIVEKQMFEEKDLEQLLHCFLSLNSRHHHGVIVQVFSEIWEYLFCPRKTTTTSITR